MLHSNKRLLWMKEKINHQNYVMRTTLPSSNNIHDYNWKLFAFVAPWNLYEILKDAKTLQIVHNVTCMRVGIQQILFENCITTASLIASPNNVHFWLIKFAFQLELRMPNEETIKLGARMRICKPWQTIKLLLSNQKTSLKYKNKHLAFIVSFG